MAADVLLMFLRTNWILSIIQLITCLGTVKAQVVSGGTNSTTSLSLSDEIPKALITVGVLVIAFAIGIGIAKLVDFLHDKQAISDNASDMSDYTREILKAQFLMAFNKARSKQKKESPKDRARRIARMWRAKVARNKARRIKASQQAALEDAEEGVANKVKDKEVTPVRNTKEKTNDQDKPKQNTKDKSQEKGNKKKTEKDVKGVNKSKEKDVVLTAVKVTDTDGMTTTVAKGKVPMTANQKKEKPTIKSTGKGTDKDANGDGIASNVSTSPVDNNNKNNNQSVSSPEKNIQDTPSPDFGEDSNDDDSSHHEPPKSPRKNVSPIQKGFLQFRGDSDDLMIPIKMAEKEEEPAILMYERETSISSSKSSKEEYEFLSEPGESERGKSSTPGRRENQRGTPGSELSSKHTDVTSLGSSKTQASTPSRRPRSAARPITHGNRRPVPGRAVPTKGARR